MTPFMDRSRSSTPIEDAPSHDSTTAQPPWEQRTFARVPYMSPSAPPLTQVERQALPSLWATREATGNERPQRQGSFDHGNVAASVEEPNLWNRKGSSTTRPPLTAGHPPVPLSSAPYETQVQIPFGPKSAPHLPSFVKALPSPPHSTTPSRSSTKSSADQSRTHYPSPPPQPVVTAMPGTMSARERTPSRSRKGSSNRSRVGSVEKRSERSDQPTFGQRFKVRVKDMFKREPVDETAFVRIGDKHWTEE